MTPVSASTRLTVGRLPDRTRFSATSPMMLASSMVPTISFFFNDVPLLAGMSVLPPLRVQIGKCAECGSDPDEQELKQQPAGNEPDAHLFRRFAGHHRRADHHERKPPDGEGIYQRGQAAEKAFRFRQRVGQ